MTSQKDQIQRLIAEIEATLAKPASRLPLGLSGEADRQRQLLDRLVNYLQSLDKMFDSPGGWGPIDPGTGQFVSPPAAATDIEESASQVLQGLLLEMQYLRENSLKPMRQELEALQQKRDSLQAEVNVLEAQRGPNPLQSEQQISAFLETLMQRLQEQLSAQMVQNFAAMETAAMEQLSAADNPSLLLSEQRLAQVRLLQAQSDQLLLKLDSTLTAVFDSLQKSVDSYRDSLEEGLDQMHGLGRQGEVIFHAFINHLAQQLGQDASLYLTGDLGAAVQQAVQPTAADVNLNAVQLDELDQALENLALEESLAEDSADAVVEPDLALDEISLDEDITVIQTAELADLEDAIAFEDDDITLIQTDSDFDQNLEVDLEEEITVIQTDDAFDLNLDLDLIEEATSFNDGGSSDDAGAAEDFVATIEDGVGAASLPLIEDVDVGDPTADLPEAPALGEDIIDESFGLLAVGADSNKLQRDDETTDDGSPDELPQIDAENELFSFDADFDLGLESDEEDEEPVDLLAAALFPEPTETEETDEADDLSVLNLTESTETVDAEQPVDLLDANRVVDDWLFERAVTEEGDGDAFGASESLGAPEGVAIEPIDSVEDDQDVLPEITVETLFGDSLGPQNESNDEGPEGDTVTSLAELLPDEQTSEAAEDFPDNVPDDIYIAASVDEDLINLVDEGSEQRLLIDLDDEQLVEQLDEDLQKLAGDTFSADYGVEEDDALEPLDQDTLETIVKDLNLEDLDLETESSLAEPADFEGLKADDESSDKVAEGRDEEAAALLQQTIEDPVDRDLFEGFATDIVDVDDPSADELDLASITSSSLANVDPETQDLDLLGLVSDPLTDEFNEFDDGLSDSLADELGGLSERSNVLSQESTEEVVGQLLSDLEEPVVGADEFLEITAVDDTEPQLDSASMPDLPPEFMVDDDDMNAEDSPEADDFLQAEQEAFWRTIAEEEPQTETDGANNSLAQSDAEVERVLDASAASAAADDLGDLLVLDDLPQPSDESVDVGDLNLEDLDELFGQSSVPELEELDQDGANVDDAQITDPLVELGLDVATSPEELLSEPEAFVPELDSPAAPVESALPLVEPIASSGAERIDTTSLVTEPSVTEPLVDIPPIDLQGEWFLGLDVGATGLSAVLMNRRTGQVYPLYWQIATEDTKYFRLPAVAVMTAAQDTVAVGYDALGDLEDLLNEFGPSTPELVGVNRLKPLLKVAVGHGQTLPNSDPWLRWSDTVELPMLQVLQAMVALIKYLVDRGKVVGLDSDSLKQIWENLQGVIVGYPTNWPDTYSFNLREAVLAAGLITQPEQILFVEDAIATILSGLPNPNDVSVADTISLSRQPSLYNCQWQEGTVIISGGAVMTELGLVNLPKDLTSLNYADFALRGFAYAGDALDQDIVCQLLLPEERRQPLSETDAGINWDWQGHLAPEDADWSQLKLDGLTLPAVGHVDWAQRYQLRHRLLGSSLGQSLLAAARHLKLVLQQQNQMEITLAGQRWLIKRRHLENLIFLPYIQRINRYLNVLLSHHTVDTQAIKQVICTGGSASLPAIARWLRQKFPNATIIQDTYASELPHSCSRVAYGLVNLARYPQVLNVTRQQYSDYFLLMELLRVFPQQPLPVGAIMHLLEQRGINTQACHLHILALLEGHLPPGLVPTAADRGLICDRTTDLSTYRALLQTPLFSKTVTESGGQMYIPNEAQAEQLRVYISRLLVNKVQTLEEPLIAHLEVLV